MFVSKHAWRLESTNFHSPRKTKQATVESSVAIIDKILRGDLPAQRLVARQSRWSRRLSRLLQSAPLSGYQLVSLVSQAAANRQFSNGIM